MFPRKRNPVYLSELFCMEACLRCQKIEANDKYEMSFSIIFRKRSLVLCVLLTRVVFDCGSPPTLQGITMELLCGFAPPGPHMDVGRPRHHRPALCTISDPLCCLWFIGRLRYCHGTLHPAQRGISMTTGLIYGILPGFICGYKSMLISPCIIYIIYIVVEFNSKCFHTKQRSVGQFYNMHLDSG